MLVMAGIALRAGEARGTAGGLWVGCRPGGSGHRVTGIDARGGLRFDLPLPGRGHAIAFHPAEPVAVVFARRPGRFAVVLDHEEGVARLRIDAAPGRHFYGHGAFSADGRHLFTSENDWATGRGVVGIRDASDGYRQVGELPAHGTGPHELRLMQGGGTLVVANGGIRTHPEQGRAKLDIATMRPSLAFVDPADGALRDAFGLAPELHKLSIRHLDVAADGSVALAMQHEGSRRDEVPLLGLFEGGGIRLFGDSAALARRLRHYAGSIAFDRSGTVIALTSPRAGLVTFWDRAGRLLDTLRAPDGCGVAAAGENGAFLVSGSGLHRYGPASRTLEPFGPPALQGPWDNHLAVLDPPPA